MKILEEKEVKIRKSHECIFCHEIHLEGSQMMTQVNDAYGEIGRVYWCMSCEKLKEAGNLYYDEHVREYPRGSVDEDKWNARTEGFVGSSTQAYVEWLGII